MILFDSKAPSGSGTFGGNGVAFNWRLLSGLSNGSPFALSGGLHAGNVGEALARTGATLLDVSSGVESAPGEKDADLVRQFIATAKGATT